MTRDEVIKALECCALRDPDDKPRCSTCPYPSGSACGNRLKVDALALLKATPKVQIIGVYGFTVHSSKDPEYAEERQMMAEHLAKDMAIYLLKKGMIQITEHDREDTPMDADFYPDGFNAVVGVKIKVAPSYEWKETED